jgi:hypothetical protein
MHFSDKMKESGLWLFLSMSKVSHCLSLRRKFCGFEMLMHWEPLMFTRVTGLQYTAVLIDMCSTDVTVTRKCDMFLEHLQEEVLLGRSETYHNNDALGKQHFSFLCFLHCAL